MGSEMCIRDRLFSSFNILTFALPAHWMWSDIGFLKYLGARDAAGSGAVHLVGGFSGLFSENKFEFSRSFFNMYH